MGDGSKIQWTDATWNPIRGCRRKNSDCINCYAEKVATRFSGPGQAYEGLVDDKGRWNGAIRFVEEHLFDPLRWRRPRLVFVNSMSDLFYEDLRTEQIDQIVAVMALAKQHTFQVLTKRPKRMAEYLSSMTLMRLYDIARVVDTTRLSRYDAPGSLSWPLPNVWWGASAGHQESFDGFRPHLMACRPHAAVLWWSLEPLVGPIEHDFDHECGDPPHRVCPPEVDWVVVGGESNGRYCAVEWIERIVERAHGGRVPVFVKQLGSWPSIGWDHTAILPLQLTAGDRKIAPFLNLSHSKGGDPAEWPESVRVREYPQFRERAELFVV